MSPKASVRLPLSAAQRDIWLAHALDPSGRRYNVGEYREMRGPVDPELVRAAFRQLVVETDALRIRGIGADEDGPWQELHAEPGDQELTQVDVSGADDPAAAARAWMEAELARPFDLASDWLTRHALVKAGEELWFYFHGFHHLVIDGAGLALLDARLVELYAQAEAGEPWGPSPFGSLAELLAEDAAYRASEDAVADRAYWRERLAGMAPSPRIGGGRSEPVPEGSLPFVRRTVTLPAPYAQRLRETARAHRAPWTMMVIALVAAYVRRASGSGEDELTLALPVTARTTEPARRTPGMASNIIPLRLPVPATATLADLLKSVVSETRQGLRRQRTRFEEMGGAAEPGRSAATPARTEGAGTTGRPSASPQVNIMAFAPGMRFFGVPTTQHNLGNGPVEDLAVAVYDLGPEDGLRIDFDASPETCDTATVAAHQDRFVRFVGTVLATPERPLAEVELLDQDESRQVLGEWAGVRDVGADDRTLTERFEEQARSRPDATAVIFGEDRLSYGRLDARANQLAHHLRATAGLGRGDLAGILLDRSPDLAVAILAVLKTGAGYALLDPEFPDERLTGTATDAGLTTLVTTAGYAERVSGRWSTVRTDAEGVEIAAMPASGLGVALTVDDPACVMFTSGSTGRPKGILSTHRNLTSTLTHQTHCAFGPDEVFLQCSPVSWDAFSLEFWGALLHGGTTVLQPGQRPEPALIADLAPRHRVTMLQLSSSLFNYLTDEHPDTFTTTHTVHTGGEPASPTHIRALQDAWPHITVVNGYGPAESMGFTTTHTVPRSGGEVPPTVSIGRPLVNKQAYVLDDHLRPVPPGTTGELYLAGHGIAHGYLAQPTTTATRFIPHPYGPPGTRLYRTGDHAHWDTHGNLHYTGRTDTQIKIRGFRIEPTEIETLLTTHPHLTQATVTYGEGRLTAYVTAGPDGLVPEPAAVRTWLRERLPDHMVPAFVVPLDRLPLTPNGKIDKRALPEPTAPDASDRGRPPRTPLEEIVCAEFAEVLGLAGAPSADADFFELGGHSLLAARLANRLASALDARLGLREVFGHSTPARLAAHLADRTGKRAALPPRTAPGRRPERLPLSFAQQRLWLVNGLEAGGTAYNVPMAVRLDGPLDVTALRAAFRDLAERHEPLRTRIAVTDGEPHQVVDPAGDVSFTVREVAPEEVDAAVRAAAGHVFDLAAEAPLRVTVLRTGPASAVLLVLLHHIATDGQSLSPLFADLSEAYVARRSGRQPDWPPLPLAYADHALWERSASAGPVLDEQLAYWREALAGLPEELGLVHDRPRPPVAGQRGGAVEVDFGPELGRQVSELARRERCTPFMVVQAALAAALTRLGAGTDIPLGSPVAGRSEEHLTGLVGFFVNTLVLRTDTSGDPEFRELLRRVRTTDLDAFAHQDVPFDLVLEAVNPVRSLARHPLFQVCLAVERGPAPAPDFPGVRAGAAEPVVTGAVKFDLEFLLRTGAADGGPGADGLAGTVLFSADVFERATVERMVGVLHRVLEQAVSAPRLRVSELEPMADRELLQVLGEWAGVRDVGADDRPLTERFEEQARLRPDATAVIFGEDRLSYGRLDARANRLAHHLRTTTGLGRGDLAGILLDRSPDLAVAILAVLKTGAGYALLDPEFPDERLTGTATDAGLTTLVTTGGQNGRLAGPWAAVALDETDVSGQPRTGLPVRPGPQDPACVMFTSGSTGRPKGILSTHRNLTSTLTHQTHCAFGPEEVFLQCSPVSWDAFSLEFWGALLHGGTTVLHPGQRPDPALIADLAPRHRVTMLQLSSSLFNYLTDEHPDTFTTTHTVHTGGEPASPTHTRRLHERFPELRIVNGYGPAESMGFTTTYTLDPDPAAPALPSVPIGRPLVNKQAYVLDDHLRPVPPGTTGELYLAGHGIAHGYLAQPTTTATRFIPHPYGPPGTRLYRTGDHAHWDTHGNLHYTGRTDTQIKIRGFRIEPTEIETLLTTHPHLTQATVTTRPDRHGTAQLIAYVVASDPATGQPSSAEVRLWLRERLPDHMVPAFVVPLDRLPLTPNGKIDKRALPAPHAGAGAGGEGREPSTALERTLCTAFAEALGTSAPVSLDDDFFDLGGHSLLAARLTNRLGSALDLRLTLRDVFQNPTPARLAAYLDDRSARAATTTPKPRRARPALRRRTDQERITS
ncbi:amino acid adenylation domain-containing protein [Streptomyces sp. NPDC008121]|uniref:amino acid adenylation domain-containing protein n=1 Tax=Streptomyces sp. NPDC008121 TaxID=3364809 RepID=UPI0036EC104F